MNTVHSLEKFMIDSKNKVLVTELSNIVPSIGGFMFDVVCDRLAGHPSAEACLYVKSHKTGRIVRFLVMDYVRDSEDEITHWILKPDINESGLNGWSMTIFND